MRLLDRFRIAAHKPDWRYTGEYRWEETKRAGGYVLWEKRGKFVDMNSGDVAWDPFWGISPGAPHPLTCTLPDGQHPEDAA